MKNNNTRGPDSLVKALAAEIDEWSFWERTPFLRHFFDGKSTCEIAGELKKPRITILICIFYARIDLLRAVVRYTIANRKIECRRISALLKQEINRQAEEKITEERKQKTLENILNSAKQMSLRDVNCDVKRC